MILGHLNPAINRWVLFCCPSLTESRRLRGFQTAVAAGNDPKREIAAGWHLTRTKIIYFLAVGWMVLGPAVVRAARVEQLRCEHEQNPIGIGNAHPRLSWKIIS